MLNGSAGFAGSWVSDVSASSPSSLRASRPSSTILGYAPVELRHVDELVRLRVSRKVSYTGHHVVRLLDAVIDVANHEAVIIVVKRADTVNNASGRFHHIIKLDYGTRRKPKFRKISIRTVA